MATLSHFFTQIYTITLVFFTVLTLEAVILIRSLVGKLPYCPKKKVITTKQYLKIIEQNNPASRYKIGGLLRPESTECTVCLSIFEDGDVVRKLQCNHVFHRDCLDRWLQQDSATCPLCRSQVLPEEIVSKHRRFLNPQEDEGSDEELMLLLSALHGNYLRSFL